MISEGYTFTQIKDTIITKKLTITYEDVCNVAKTIDPAIKPEIEIIYEKKGYYKTEQDIFDEIEKDYRVEDLIGWEKQRLNFDLKIEDKLKR